MTKNTVTLKYTPQTPTRTVLLGVALAFLSYATGNIGHVDFSVISSFIMGVIILFVRELISNGDHFNEFMEHIKDTYEILPPKNDEELEEPEEPEEDGNKPDNKLNIYQ